MTPGAPAIDEALPALRALLAAGGLDYRLVGGIAVVHHGYLRATRDLVVLVPAGADEVLAPLCAAHGFLRESRTRLRHVASGTSIDLLIAGDAMPRAGRPPYPRPEELDASASAEARDVVGLVGLITLKLRAGRLQDLADVAALLKPLDDGSYLALEAEVERSLRGELASLREEALQERAWEEGAR